MHKAKKNNVEINEFLWSNVSPVVQSISPVQWSSPLIRNHPRVMEKIDRLSANRVLQTGRHFLGHGSSTDRTSINVESRVTAFVALQHPSQSCVTAFVASQP